MQGRSDEMQNRTVGEEASCNRGQMQGRSYEEQEGRRKGQMQYRICRAGRMKDRFRYRTGRMQGRSNAGQQSLVDAVQERVGLDRYSTGKSRKKEIDRTGGRQERRQTGKEAGRTGVTIERT